MKNGSRNKNSKLSDREKKPTPKEGMHPISWGETIQIFLKETPDKNERLKIANQAKKLIDMYVEE